MHLFATFLKYLVIRYNLYYFMLASKSQSPFFRQTMSNKSSSLNRSRNPMDFDYNDVEPLTRFVTETGKILPRKETGLSAKLQRRVTKLIKQGRNMLTMK